MRVLMIVQQVDERNWLRGFIVGWIRELAKHFETLHVLTLEQGEASLPENVIVHSMGKEKGYSRPRELWEFYRGLAGSIGKVDVIFSHMTPRYTWLASPLAAIYGKPQMLWFTHPKASLETKTALRTARWIVTATETSFPIHSEKVHVMGHGIDTNFFSPAPNASEMQPPLILAVGRVTPIKYHHTLLEAAALLRERGISARFVVAGGTAAQGDEAYQAELLRQRDALGLTSQDFELTGALPVDEILALTRQATIVTNLTPPGSFDKAALEGMLVGKPLIYCNPAFDALTGEAVSLLRAGTPDDALTVADRLAGVLALEEAERIKLGLALRERTATAHGLENLMQRLVVLMKS
jgi:glycosyltransferase involved in cell wall biosynthesis